jgi:hypothetical protein
VKQNGPKIREYFKEFINRNHMLYCLHSNKKATLFYKNKLSMLGKRAKQLQQETFTQQEKRECLVDLGREIREYIFMEHGVHPTCERAFDEAASEWIVKFNTLDVDKVFRSTCKIDQSFFPLKIEIDRFLKSKETDDKKISEFLSKLVKLETNVSNVTRFVRTCVKKMLPERFLGRKNKEYLLGKVSECVSMKKYEMLSFKEVYKRVS